MVVNEPSIQPTTKENLVVGDCMKREFIEIVVDYPPADLCTYPEYRGKPYFSIKYRENGKTYVGFGTYKIEMLSQWIKEYFMPSVQPKPKTGHWIAQDIHNCHTDFRCSECGYIHSFMHLYGKPTADYTYCPKCGAKMLPTDSDKEWLPQYEGKWVTEKE